MNHEQFTHDVLQRAQQALIKYGSLEKLPSGKKVIKEGDLTEHLYYVSQGELKTFGVASVFPVFLGKITAGETFGEASFLLGGKKATATVMTVKECEIYKISFDKLLEILKEDHVDSTPIMFYLAHMFAKRIRRLDVNVFKPGLLEEHLLPE